MNRFRVRNKPRRCRSRFFKTLRKALAQMRADLFDLNDHFGDELSGMENW